MNKIIITYEWFALWAAETEKNLNGETFVRKLSLHKEFIMIALSFKIEIFQVAGKTTGWILMW